MGLIPLRIKTHTWQTSDGPTVVYYAYVPESPENFGFGPTSLSAVVSYHLKYGKNLSHDSVPGYVEEPFSGVEF